MWSWDGRDDAWADLGREERCDAGLRTVSTGWVGCTGDVDSAVMVGWLGRTRYERDRGWGGIGRDAPSRANPKLPLPLLCVQFSLKLPLSDAVVGEADTVVEDVYAVGEDAEPPPRLSLDSKILGMDPVMAGANPRTTQGLVQFPNDSNNKKSLARLPATVTLCMSMLLTPKKYAVQG